MTDSDNRTPAFLGRRDQRGLDALSRELEASQRATNAIIGEVPPEVTKYAPKKPEPTTRQLIAELILQLPFGDMVQVSEEMVGLPDFKAPASAIDIAFVLHRWAQKSKGN